MDELGIRVAGKEDVGALASLMTELGYPSKMGYEATGYRFYKSLVNAHC